MDFKAIVSRLTGIYTPVFGVSWNPPEIESESALRVIAFLEDRRVLYVPSEMEIPDHCVQSVIAIRQFLTTELQRLNKATELSKSLRAMRSACRRFMNTVGARSDIVMSGAHRNHWASWEFNGAIGELRGVFGVHIARLAVLYGLSVEDGLASILPAQDEVDENDLGGLM